MGTIALHVCKKTQLVPVYTYCEKFALQQFQIFSIDL